MVTFLLSVHIYYRNKAIGRAEPERWIFQPGQALDLARPGVAPPL